MHLNAFKCHHDFLQPLNRGGGTAIELFIAGIRGWEAGLRRQLEGGKPKAD
jgi:hypothetical protein